MSTIKITLEDEGPRRCGGCTLCCKLLPVRELDKKANERCKHQRTGKGCAIYGKPSMPPSCRLWNCRWLVDDVGPGMRRPDRVHYVIDVMPDFITLTEGEEKVANVEVIQVWVDPDYPDAHHDPALRAYLAREGEQGKAAIIRYSAHDAFVLFPPAMTGGTWEERRGSRHMSHTPEEIFAGLAEARQVKIGAA